jgi:hypothetical protein
MASLQSALKKAIQVNFQLEDAELATEPLPTTGRPTPDSFVRIGRRRRGVLRRLLDEPDSIQIARGCGCHFDPKTSDDLGVLRATEDCEAAVTTAMSYSNQHDHDLLDRQLLREATSIGACSIKSSLTLLRSRTSGSPESSVTLASKNGGSITWRPQPATPSIAQKRYEQCGTSRLCRSSTRSFTSTVPTAPERRSGTMPRRRDGNLGITVLDFIIKGTGTPELPRIRTFLARRRLSRRPLISQEDNVARKQSEFLQIFRKAFENRFNVAPDWSGGQILTNKACFAGLDHYRRERRIRSNEGIELGDLRTSFQEWTVIVEYESSAMVVQNLLKYWPYLRGELSCAPREPILLCHFSEWSSWGSYRDLWSWLRSQIAADQSVEFRSPLSNSITADKISCFWNVGSLHGLHCGTHRICVLKLETA